jgi:hypothetical protein
MFLQEVDLKAVKLTSLETRPWVLLNCKVVCTHTLSCSKKQGYAMSQGAARGPGPVTWLPMPCSDAWFQRNKHTHLCVWKTTLVTIGLQHCSRAPHPLGRGLL